MRRQKKFYHMLRVAFGALALFCYVVVLFKGVVGVLTGAVTVVMWALARMTSEAIESIDELLHPSPDKDKQD